MKLLRDSTFILVLLAVTNAAVGQAPTQVNTKPLIQYISTNDAELTPSQDKILQKTKGESTASSIQIVKVDPLLLKADSLNINVGGAGSVLAKSSYRALSESNFSCSFGSPDAPVSAQFFVNDGVKQGTIAKDKKVYNLRPLGNGLLMLIERDPSKLPADHPKQFDRIEKQSSEKPLPPKKNEQGDAAPTSDVPPVSVSVLVLYTASVAQNHPSMKDFVESLITITNDTFKQSGIPANLTLADLSQTSYTESGSLSDDVDRLISTNDGYADEIHAQRDLRKADIVMTLVDRGDAAGYAGDILANKLTAFAVVDDEYADWYFTFAHEMGHLFGARHNPEADNSTTPFAYGHGYQHPGGKWRCLMSYNCSSNCTRVGIWSSPLIKHAGETAGTAGVNDNARVVRETISTIAGFR